MYLEGTASPDILRKLEHISNQLGQDVVPKLNQILEGEKTIMIDLAALEAKVAAVETVEGSAVTLLQTISQEVRDLSAEVAAEPAVQQKLTDFAARLDAATQPLAAAVVANTPAE